MLPAARDLQSPGRRMGIRRLWQPMRSTVSVIEQAVGLSVMSRGRAGAASTKEGLRLGLRPVRCRLACVMTDTGSTAQATVIQRLSLASCVRERAMVLGGGLIVPSRRNGGIELE